MFKNCSKVMMALIALVMTGCTHRMVDFTVISTKNVPLTQKGVDFAKAQQTVEGSDKKQIILFIPTGSPSMEEAVDRALAKYPGAIALSDGVIYSKTLYIPPFWGYNKIVVKGTPVYSPSDMPETEQARNTVKNNDDQGMRMIHKVKKGETLQTIASTYGVTIKEIVKWNQLSSIDVEADTPLIIFMK